MENSLYFQGNDFLIEADILDQQFRTDLMDCGSHGDASESVEYIMDNYKIGGNVSDCKKYLNQYGAWDESELSDHQENLRRLIWLSGCALCESSEDGCEIYFSA